MPAERDERLYLADMRDAVDRALRYTMGGREAFFADPMIQDAVIRNLEVMAKRSARSRRARDRPTPRFPGGRSPEPGTASSTAISP